MPSRTQTRAKRGPARSSEEQTNAVVVFDAKQASDKLVAALEDRRDQITSFLGADPEYAQRFLSVAIDAIVRDRNLLAADLFSLVASVRHAAIMGLEPTSVMGEGAIVVYRDNDQGGKKIAQFQPMVRGLAKLARNSGDVASLGVDVVRQGDEFEYQSGSDPAIRHRPKLDREEGEASDVIGAYAYVRLRSGELVPLYMSVAEIFKRRRVSKSYQSSGEKSIWGQWPEEMMKKTVLRRLLVEKVPLSFRAQRALALDAEIDSVDGKPEKAEAVPLPGRMAARLSAHLDESGPQSAQNGPQGADTVEGEAKDVTGGKGAPEPSDAVTTDSPTGAGPGDVVGALCGKPGPKSDAQRCIRDKHGADVMHKDADGETWL